MHSIVTQCYFEAAHRLQHHEGACRNIHGHSYKLEVKVSTEGLMTSGPAKDMCLDFKHLKGVVRGVVDEGQFMGKATVPFDHSLMLAETDPLFILLAGTNEGKPQTIPLPEFRLIGMTQEPTAEYMAMLFAQMFQAEFNHRGIKAQVEWVRLWETRHNMAEYEWPYEGDQPMDVASEDEQDQ